jgi:hypothetical protein
VDGEAGDFAGPGEQGGAGAVGGAALCGGVVLVDDCGELGWCELLLLHFKNRTDTTDRTY